MPPVNTKEETMADEIGADRQIKHASFKDSLNGLMAEIGRMETFMEKVAGTAAPPLPVSETVKDTDIESLSVFLSDSPSIVRNQTERLEKIRQELQEALF